MKLANLLRVGLQKRYSERYTVCLPLCPEEQASLSNVKLTVEISTRTVAISNLLLPVFELHLPHSTFGEQYILFFNLAIIK